MKRHGDHERPHWLRQVLSLRISPASQSEDATSKPEGVALPPEQRGCGPCYPPRGLSQEEMDNWCAEHET